MKKMRLLAGVAVVLALLLFLSGCVGMVSIPAEAPVAAVDTDYNAVYYDGRLYSYWVLGPNGFWVFTQAAFLPTAFVGRTIYRGHHPGHWGHPGNRHGGHGRIHRPIGGGHHPGGVLRPSGTHRPSGGVHRPSGRTHRPSGGVHRRR